jgi:FkbM family methyltransferase
MAPASSGCHVRRMVGSPSSLLPGIRVAPAERRALLLATYEIDLVIDVGANAGQYASALRAAGYRGRIESFEPLTAPFAELAAAARRDRAWECQRLALGNCRARTAMNVCEDSRNSSLFPVGDRHLRAVPSSRMVGVEHVSVERIDALWPELARDARRVLLKIDTQGFELEALRGATGALDTIALVEVELSLLPVYNGGPLFPEVCSFLARRGFAPIAFEGVLDDVSTGQMLQVDGVFHRVSD